jgi:hypothetical protein
MYLGFVWKDNVKTDQKEIEWEGLDRINLAQDRKSDGLW